MNKKDILLKLNKGFKKTQLLAKKKSPEIFMGLGIVGVVASTVMACKATTELGDILEDAKNDIDEIKHYAEHQEELPREYTEEAVAKDLTITYTQAAVKIVKLYAPSIALGALSLTSIIASHNILRKRNAALGAAYFTVDKCFKEYRGRVVERFGEGLDKELRFNIKPTEIETVITNDKGEEVVVKETINTAEINQYSDYAKFFDEANSNWTKDPERNLYFLKQQEVAANVRLKQDGFLFLNDVYEMIGIARTTVGQIAGWTLDETNPDNDGYIDFGIYDINKQNSRDFVNGLERVILLDFNVEGDILDKI